MDKKKLYQEFDEFHATHLNKDYSNLSFSIILVQPETAGNVGSVARLMKNFNFLNLVVFNPIEKVDHIKAIYSQGFAMHGKDVLLNADIKIVDNQSKHLSELKSYLKEYDFIIGTTAKGKRDTNVRRTAILLEDFDLPQSKEPVKIAILFGKESTGLTNEEIALCDILVRIPASDEYPTLNLSHSCGIILYELFKKLYIIKIGRGGKPILMADRNDRQILYDFIESIIQILKIRDYKEENLLFAFKNIFERALMSTKELSLLTGLFSKIESVLKKIDLYQEE